MSLVLFLGNQKQTNGFTWVFENWLCIVLVGGSYLLVLLSTVVPTSAWMMKKLSFPLSDPFPPRGTVLPEVLLLLLY